MWRSLGSVNYFNNLIARNLPSSLAKHCIKQHSIILKTKTNKNKLEIRDLTPIKQWKIGYETGSLGLK